MIQGGQIMVTSGWRYVSSFQDVIGVIPADKMPDPETLLWDEDGAEANAVEVKTADAFTDNVRERVTYKPPMNGA
jgi:hypothetical protein